MSDLAPAMPGPAAAPARRWLALVLFAGVVAVCLSLFADQLGLTYDEPVYGAVGERHVSWYGRLLHGDLSALSPDVLERHWGNSGHTPVEADWHPPVGKVILALARHLPAPGPFAATRMGNVLLFALTAVVLFLWLSEAHSLTAGAAAALAWATLPRAVAHGNLAAIDMPVTAFATLALWLAWRTCVRPGWRRGVAFGLALGLAMGAKFNGVLVAPAVLAVAAWRARGALKPLALGTFVVAPLLFWLLWPWLWYDGLLHLRQVIAFHGRHGYIATGYFGRIYTDPPPPWHYPWVMLAITTPLATLLTALLAPAARRPREEAGGRTLLPLLTAALICHLLPFSLPAAAKYNGVRLFLPGLAALAGLSGLGVAAAVDRLRGWGLGSSRWLAPGVAALAVFLPAVVGLLQVYPYPMAYYNALVGGAAGAERRGLEVSYWGDPFRELVGWLSRPGNAPAEADVYLQPAGAIAMVEMYRGVGLLRPGLRLVAGAEGERTARFFVYQNRPSEWDPLGFRLRSLPPRYAARAGETPVGFIWERPE